MGDAAFWWRVAYAGTWMVYGMVWVEHRWWALLLLVPSTVFGVLLDRAMEQRFKRQLLRGSR